MPSSELMTLNPKLPPVIGGMKASRPSRLLGSASLIKVVYGVNYDSDKSSCKPFCGSRVALAATGEEVRMRLPVHVFVGTGT